MYCVCCISQSEVVQTGSTATAWAARRQSYIVLLSPEVCPECPAVIFDVFICLLTQHDVNMCFSIIILSLVATATSVYYTSFCF